MSFASPTKISGLNPAVLHAMEKASQLVGSTRARIQELNRDSTVARAQGALLRALWLKTAATLLRVRLFTGPIGVGLGLKPTPTATKIKTGGTSATAELPGVLDILAFRKVRTNRTVFFDWVKRYLVVSTFQVLGFLTHALTEETFFQHAPYYVFFNTLVMMLLQSEVGAYHTQTHEDLGLPLPKTQDELLAQIPAMMAGRSGFVPSVKEKFLGFASLWPVEWVVLTVLNSIQILLMGNPLTTDALLKMLFVNVLSCTLFGLYLALRWASWDWIVDLAFLPGARHVAATQAETTFLGASRAQAFEMAYRYTLGFIDAYIVFGLFGSWLPSLYDRVFKLVF